MCENHITPHFGRLKVYFESMIKIISLFKVIDLNTIAKTRRLQRLSGIIIVLCLRDRRLLYTFLGKPELVPEKLRRMYPY